VLLSNDIDNVITQDAMVAFGSCFLRKDSLAVYVSTPITTGRNFLQWLRLAEGDRMSRTENQSLSRDVFVTAKNIKEAAVLVHEVRAKYTNSVIDPTRFENMDGWGQDDYHQFWIKVIRQLVSIIVFADGWEYSNGSTLEYVCGLENGLTLFTHDFQPLTPELALSKLKSAVADYSEQNVKSEIMDAAIYFLEGHGKKEQVTCD